MFAQLFHIPRLFLLITFFAFLSVNVSGQSHSISRQWNEIILEAIRNDFARPTVHARNLYHHSLIAYDAWAAYDLSKEKYFLGDTLFGYECQFNGIPIPADIEAARREAISYASFRFIENRYSGSPDYYLTYQLATDLMNQLGYDINNVSVDYENEGPAALGNYLAQEIQQYGYGDGSNELNDFENVFYDQLNPPIEMNLPGNPNIQDPNHWQPITLIQSIDQSGNPVQSTPPHLSPEWGYVHPFSLDTLMANDLTRDGDTYRVYFDTLMPAFLNPTDSGAWDSFYKWNHSLVSIWQSHLDPNDGVLWDISPASLGNNTWYPTDSTQYAAFYDLLNGGDPGTGYAVNPVTGLPYTPQIVPRGDYARVLAEFWADGIDSETPPGHWFEIYHYVSEQPSFTYQWQGVGPVLDTLEYDVKAHLTLGGTMHDAAICAWSLKGYYDYLRPVSAIRHMADLGQSSDSLLMSYHPHGIPLLPGYIELVYPGDTLAGQWNEHVGKIKLFTWKGHDYIPDPTVDMAGVGWILAENWWPYQRPTFVTPPFAGFVSGHSTFSRAAANILEFITGSPYFPGGMGEFQAIQNEYLQFEEGPSMTITLQWASYKDAADQCSLSRLWGGIHPPIDDIPGRMIGEEIGAIAFNKADSIFMISHPALISASVSDSIINIADISGQFSMDFWFNVPMDTSVMPTINFLSAGLASAISVGQISWLDSFNVVVQFDVLSSSVHLFNTLIELDGVFTGTGNPMGPFEFKDFFLVDTKNPLLNQIVSNVANVSDLHAGSSLNLELRFDEKCDTSVVPVIDFVSAGYVNPTFQITGFNTGWQEDSIYIAEYLINDFNEAIVDLQISVSQVNDIHDNPIMLVLNPGVINIDTKNPLVTSIVTSDTMISRIDIGSVVQVDLTFDQAMDTTLTPILVWEDQGAVYPALFQNTAQTLWLDTNVLTSEIIVLNDQNDLISLDLLIDNCTDTIGNTLADSLQLTVLFSDLKGPIVNSIQPSRGVIFDSLVGATEYFVDIEFSEGMDTLVKPLVQHLASQNLTNSIQYNLPASEFIDPENFRAYFQVIDENVEIEPIHVQVDFAKDSLGNQQETFIDSNVVSLDTKNPIAINVTANDYIIDQNGEQFNVLVVFDEEMDTTIYPMIQLSPLIQLPLSFSYNDSNWVNTSTYSYEKSFSGSSNQWYSFDIQLSNSFDIAGNVMIEFEEQDFVSIAPILGLAGIQNEHSLLVYPSIISSGEVVRISGIYPGFDQSSAKLINTLGELIATLEIAKEDNHLVTSTIDVSSGMYYIIVGQTPLKIIVK